MANTPVCVLLLGDVGGSTVSLSLEDRLRRGRKSAGVHTARSEDSQRLCKPLMRSHWWRHRICSTSKYVRVMSPSHYALMTWLSAGGGDGDGMPLTAAVQNCISTHTCVYGTTGYFKETSCVCGDQNRCFKGLVHPKMKIQSLHFQMQLQEAAWMAVSCMTIWREPSVFRLIGQLQVICRLILALKRPNLRESWIFQCVQTPIDQWQKHVESFGLMGE